MNRRDFIKATIAGTTGLVLTLNLKPLEANDAPARSLPALLKKKLNRIVLYDNRSDEIVRCELESFVQKENTLCMTFDKGVCYQTGEPTHFCLEAANGDMLYCGTIGEIGSGSDLELTSPLIGHGDSFLIHEFNIVM